MNPKIKLTYIFLLKYNLNVIEMEDRIVPWYYYPISSATPTVLVGAQIKSQKYNLNVDDVWDFIEQFKPRDYRVDSNAR